MLSVDLCEECGVPKPFTQAHIWLSNGDIVQRINPKARLVFFESENLDPLFKNIGDIIAMPIERQIINITSRGTELYMKHMIPSELKEMIQSKQMDPMTFIDTVNTYCHTLGYGKYECLGYRYENDEDDFIRFRIYRPFSVPEAAGALAGAVSASVGGEHEVAYEEVSPGLFEFTTTWTKYPEVLKEKLRIHSHKPREGNIELDGCLTCGGPADLADYHWDLEEGLILSRQTGTRMVLLGSEMIDQLFKALEAELGEVIPEVVVEAQRRFVRTGFYSTNILQDEDEFRRQLALRGQGNLKEIKMSPEGLHVHIDNPCGSLMVIGMIQGLFEIVHDVDSSLEWELSDEGGLNLSVKAI